MQLLTRFRRLALTNSILTRVLAGITVCYLLFVLPYSFPPSTRLVSASYLFGFNNKVAVFTFVAFLLFLSWIRQRLPAVPGSGVPGLAPGNARHLHRTLLLLYIGAAIWYLALTATIYFVVAKPDGYYKFDWESSQFLWHLKLMDIYGLRPYRDFVVEYGPALVYLPAWFYTALRPIGISPEASYYILHYFLNLIGLAALLYIVNSFAMPLRFKRVTFLLVAVSAFSPAMGLNGLLIRFLLPYASLLLVHRANLRADKQKPRRRLAAIVGAASIVNIVISPEIGIAWLGALTIYGALLLPSDRTAAACIFLSEAAVMAVSAALLPGAYFHTVLSFSQGANNFPIVPAAHILFYAAVVLLCVPRLLVSRLLEVSAEASYACAVGALIIAVIPAVLGRCDPPHVFLNGLGLFTIGFGLFAQSGSRQFVMYSVAYAAIAIVAFQWSNAQVYGISGARVRSGVSRIYSSLHRHTRNSPLNSAIPTTASSGNTNPAGTSPMPSFAAFEKYQALGLPYGSYGYEKSLQNYLWSTKRLVPERYMAVLAVYDEPHLKERLTELSRISPIVVQKNFLKLYEHRNICAEKQEYLKQSFLYFSAPPCVQEGLDPDIEMAKFIARHYHQIDQIGDYLILERTETK